MTAEMLSPRWLEKTIFVVCPEEAGRFENELVCAEPGVAPARQAALDHCDEQYLFMFDDDLRFCQRVDDWDLETNPRCRMSTKEDVDEILDIMEATLEEYAAVGFGPRGNNNSLKETKWSLASRMMRAFGIDVEIFREEGIRFDEFKYWEDFHVTLELLKRGYPNAISARYLVDSVTNADGGVSLYRNADDLRRVRERFVEYHSPFVKPVDKTAKSWANHKEDTVPDVRIAWKKAWSSACEE